MKKHTYRNKDGKEIIATEYYQMVFIGRGQEAIYAKTLDEADQMMANAGYTRKGFVDEQGATRHALSRGEIEMLYRKLDNFISDCTVQECERYKDALIGVKTLLHQRMQE